MTGTKQTLTLAWQYHQAGKFFQAEQLYRRLLDAEPGQAEVWCLLGGVCQAQGKLDEAVASYQQALRGQPDYVEALNNLGVALARLSRLPEAEAAFRHALRLRPDHADAHNNLGNALREQGRAEAAQASFREALRYQPDHVDARNNLGLLLHHQGSLAEAEAAFRKVLQLRPGHGEAYLNLGLTLSRQGRLEEAAASLEQAAQLRPEDAQTHFHLANVQRALGRFKEAEAGLYRAVRLRPDYAEAYNNLGNLLRELDRMDEASANLRRAANLLPASAEVHNNLGNVLRQQGKLEEGIACLEEALRLQPHYAQALSNLGVALLDQGRREEAATRLRQALTEQPDLAEAHNNLGAVLLELGQLDQALDHIQEALRLLPENAGGRRNRAMVWLLQGNFEAGWAEYECRWGSKELPARTFSQPVWDGSSLHERTILVHAEQGLGDTIQFIRYVSLVKARGGRVMVEYQPPLRKLLAGCPGIDQLIPRGAALPAFDVHAPLMSLPRILQTALATVPARVPYLSPDPGLVAHWQRQLAPVGGFRIGIAWQGNPKYPKDRHRSIPLAHFEALARLSGVRLISLQKGSGTEQLEPRAEQLDILVPGKDVDGAAGAFMDTAALMANLDLVVTSDSAVAHLAGALAVPVWLALPYAPDWRWLLEREDSPWYPTMRLFRQKEAGNWDQVFERMAAEVQSLARERGRACGIPVAISPGELLDQITFLEIEGERLTDLAQVSRVRAKLEGLRRARAAFLPPSPELERLGVALRAVNTGLWQGEADLRACEQAGDFGSRFIELARAVNRGKDERAALVRQIDELLDAPRLSTGERRGVSPPVGSRWLAGS